MSTCRIRHPVSSACGPSRGAAGPLLARLTTGPEYRGCGAQPLLPARLRVASTYSCAATP